MIHFFTNGALHCAEIHLNGNKFTLMSGDRTALLTIAMEMIEDEAFFE